MSDAEARYATAESFLDGSAGVLPERFAWKGASKAPDGRVFTFFGPMQSVVMVPVIAVSRALPVSAGIQVLAAKFLLTAAVFPAISAAAVLAVAVAAMRLGLGRREAWLGAGLVALGTPFWHYARIGQEESLVAAGWAVWFLGLERVSRGRGSGALLASGGLCVAVLTRWSAAPPVLFLAALSVWVWVRTEQRPRMGWLIGAGALAVSCAGGLVAYNAWRFGSPFETGYGLVFKHMQVRMFSVAGMPEGFAGLLVNPNRGLLWFALPVLLLALRSAWRGPMPRWALAGGPVALGVVIAVTAAYTIWGGGFGWGPRYLVSTMVLFVPQLGMAAASLHPGVRKALVALAIAWQVPSVVLPSTTEDLVQKRDGCSYWSLSCSAVALRPRLAAAALVNTVTGRTGRALGPGEVAETADVLETSDYQTVNLWPVRAAIRFKLFPPWLGLLVTALQVAIGVVALRRSSPAD